MGVRNGNWHASLSFHSDMGWSNLDLEREVGLLQLSRYTVPKEPGIRFVHVELSELIEMFQRTLFCHFDDGSSNLDMAERLLWIIGKHRHFWVAPHVLFFAKPAHGVDQHVVTISVAPDGCGLWLTIRHNGCQRHASVALKQTLVRF